MYLIGHPPNQESIALVSAEGYGTDNNPEEAEYRECSLEPPEELC